MVSPEKLTTLIQDELPDAQVQLEDLTGGGDHYQAIIVSEAFTGKTLVQQHQLVYKAVNSIMADESLHALALKTFTPETWSTRAS